MATKNLKPVEHMTIGELRNELYEARRIVNRWVEAYNKAGNERCHELDQELARIVGAELYPNRYDHSMTASLFQSCCTAYINRECGRGRLVDDRQKQKRPNLKLVKKKK